jgi:hypothetical protein
MKISEVLKTMGFFSNDIKNRFKNKQIKINGVQTDDIDLDIVDIMGVVKNNDVLLSTWEAGDFLYDILIDNPDVLLKIKLIGIDNAFDVNIENDCFDFLSNFLLLQVSKNDKFILLKN